MRGISFMTQVVFAIILVAVISAFLFLDFLTPAITSYGNEHAQMIAQSISTSINSLSREDQGTVYRELGLAWDIRIYQDDEETYITVKHDKFKSGDILIISKAQDFKANGIDHIYIIKEPGKIPRLEV